jgi:hypothetical protein
VPSRDEIAAYDFMRNRKKAYQLAFTDPAGQAVLHDLAKFCRANVSCFDPDPRLHAALEGRREVWLRIQDHLNLTSDQLYAIATGRTFTPSTEIREPDDE